MVLVVDVRLKPLYKPPFVGEAQIDTEQHQGKGQPDGDGRGLKCTECVTSAAEQQGARDHPFHDSLKDSLRHRRIQLARQHRS